MAHRPAESDEATLQLGGASAPTGAPAAAPGDPTQGPTSPTIPTGGGAQPAQQDGRMPAPPSGHDRYLAQGDLGQGGWGKVVRARDRQLDRDVAVKQISENLAGDSAIRARFLYEATVTGQLQHPGIVPVHELGVSGGGAPFYVMKLLEGQTLKQLIGEVHNAPERLSGGFCVDLLKRYIDVCNAVAYAHQQGFLHRDLKPANVMTGRFGETLVVDWGLAKRLRGADAQALEDESDPEQATLGAAPAQAAPAPDDATAPDTATRHGAVLGTPAYMSPEQSAGLVDSLTEATDIYALGVILYEILTGANPFRSHDVSTTLARVQNGEYRPPREINRRVPRPLAAIAVKAMARRAEDRYASADQIVEDIERFLAGDAVTAFPEPMWRRAVRWCRRRPAITAGVLGSGVVLTAASLVFGMVIARAHRAEHAARLAAEAAYRQADARLADARVAGDAWLINLSGALESYPGLGPLRKELLADATRHYERLADEARAGVQTPGTRLELAKCVLRLGDLQRLTGDRAASVARYRSALELLTARASAPAEPDADWRLETINAQIGLLLAGEPPNDDALKAEQDWLSDRLQTPNTSQAAEGLRCANTLARLLLARSRGAGTQSEEAVALLTRAERWARWLVDQRGEPRDHQILQTISDGLAAALYDTGAVAQAAEVWTREVDRIDQRVANAGQRPDLIQARAYARMKQAHVQSSLGRPRQAEASYADAIDDLQHAWRQTDSDGFYRRNLAISKASLGVLAAEQNGAADQAMSDLVEAVEWLRSGVSDQGAAASDLARLAQCYEAMGRIGQRIGREEARGAYAAAEQCYQVIREHRQLTGDRPARLARLLLASSALHLQQGDAEEAELDLQDARRFTAESLEQIDDLPAPDRAWVGNLQTHAAWQELRLLEASSDADALAEARSRLLELARRIAADELSTDALGAYPVSSQLLVDCLLESGLPSPDELAEAEDVLQRMRAALPACRDSAAWNQRRALVEWMRGDRRGAERALHATLARSPEDAICLTLLSATSASAPQEAAERIEGLRSQFPGDRRLSLWSERALATGAPGPE